MNRIEGFVSLSSTFMRQGKTMLKSMLLIALIWIAASIEAQVPESRECTGCVAGSGICKDAYRVCYPGIPGANPPFCNPPLSLCVPNNINDYAICTGCLKVTTLSNTGDVGNGRCMHNTFGDHRCVAWDHTLNSCPQGFSQCGLAPTTFPGTAHSIDWGYPGEITTHILVGDTVIWTVTQGPQTVDAVYKDQLGFYHFSSGRLDQGATFYLTFYKPGTFLYQSSYNPTLTGQIIVATSTTTTSTTSTAAAAAT
eukprot:m.100519 g.100519  ORF g.100519 m.100519 type:complete len:253 (-) comp14941_c0_seq2:102-860(-)